MGLVLTGCDTPLSRSHVEATGWVYNRDRLRRDGGGMGLGWCSKVVRSAGRGTNGGVEVANVGQ